MLDEGERCCTGNFTFGRPRRISPFSLLSETVARQKEGRKGWSPTAEAVTATYTERERSMGDELGDGCCMGNPVFVAKERKELIRVSRKWREREEEGLRTEREEEAAQASGDRLSGKPFILVGCSCKAAALSRESDCVLLAFAKRCTKCIEPIGY